MQNIESSNEIPSTSEDWELVSYEGETIDIDESRAKTPLQLLTDVLKTLIHYAMNLFENNASIHKTTSLLQNGHLYNPDDERFTHIVEQAKKILCVGPDGTIPVMRLSRMLNGDSYGLSAPLSSEVRQHIENLTLSCIMEDIDDENFIDAHRQLSEFILMQASGFRPVLLHSGNDGKIQCRLAPEISDFLWQNKIDSISQEVVEEILSTLAQLTLELTCTRESRFQDWLGTPDTFNLNRLFVSTKARKEAMPDVLIGVLQIIAPLAYLQHEKHFGNMMHLIILLVQKGLVAVREDLIAIYTDNPEPKSDKGKVKQGPGFFHGKKEPKVSEERDVSVWKPLSGLKSL